MVCADIDEAGARETADQINAGPPGACPESRCHRAGAGRRHGGARARGFGSVHFLFNSAGAALSRAKFLDIDDALLGEPSRSISTARSTPCRRCCRNADNKFGVIVNVGQHGAPARRTGTSVHYAAAKGAVVSMTLGVAREFAAQGIRALSISPGPIDDAVPGRGGLFAGTGEALSRRRADGPLRHA